MADPVQDALTIAMQGFVNAAVQNAVASLTSEVSALRARIQKLEGTAPVPTPVPVPAPPPPAIADDPEGTWKNGVGSSVRWTPPGGRQSIWSISPAGKIFQDGASTFVVGLTANVNGIGIINGLLCHRVANGTGYSWTGDQHWQPGARVPQLQVNATIAGAVQA